MNNVLEYKDYYGTVEFSQEDGLLFGKVIGISGLISYEGDSVQSLEQNFKEAVDDYLDTCKQNGKSPMKSYKGSFNVRIKPDLHRDAVLYAATHNKSLNAFVAEAIEYKLHQQ